MSKRDRWLFKMPKVLGPGYHEFLTPKNSDLEYLTYGRLRLEEGKGYKAATEDDEVALICLKGRSIVKVSDQDWKITQHDLVYIPRDTKYVVENPDRELLDIAVAKAPSTIDVKSALVRFEDVKKDPQLHRIAGIEPCAREVFLCLGPNVEACRLLLGYAWAKPGNWTSWPPHEHGARQEEVYLYYHLPKPGFAIQLVYTDPEDIEFTSVVRQDDAVVIPRGYHPNVVTPKFEMRFLWMICGRRPVVDREYGVWTYQRGFE